MSPLPPGRPHRSPAPAEPGSFSVGTRRLPAPANRRGGQSSAGLHEVYPSEQGQLEADVNAAGLPPGGQINPEPARQLEVSHHFTTTLLHCGQAPSHQHGEENQTRQQPARRQRWAPPASAPSRPAAPRREGGPRQRQADARCAGLPPACSRGSPPPPAGAPQTGAGCSGSPCRGCRATARDTSLP